MKFSLQSSLWINFVIQWPIHNYCAMPYHHLDISLSAVCIVNQCLHPISMITKNVKYNTEWNGEVARVHN